MDASQVPLPEGSSGWPVFGEALAFGANPFAFLAERIAKHGAVARSRLLDKNLAILAGPAAAAAFIDEANVTRAGGLPPHAAALFGRGVVNQIDADAHRRRKRHLMRALDAEALSHYLPEMRARIRARMARWVAAREVGLQDECIRLTLELTLANFVGLAPEGDAALDRWAKGYADFGKALFGLPLPLPGTPLARARAFTQEALATFGTIADARRTAPTGDAASRLAASEIDGDRLATADIARELQHLQFAAGGMWGWMCFGAKVLTEDVALAGRLRAVAAALPADPSPRDLVQAGELVNFVREVKRLALVIPMTAIGIAQRDFAVAGRRVPKGWLVVWATNASHAAPGLAPYASPERFDPGRYARGEGAAAHHFAPQGPGEALTSHRCGGVEYSTLVLLQFFTELLRASAISLPAQDLSQDLSGIPARWRGGLRVRFG
jgi:fatty-acid peroxygenase